MRNKRGDADTYVATSKWLYYILAVAIVSFSIIFFVGKGSSFLDSKASVSPTLEEDLLVSRLVNVCFSYEKDGRIYQNIIDATKVSDGNLAGCVDTSLTVVITSLDNSFEPYFAKVGTGIAKESFVRYTLLELDGKRYPATIEVFS
ncbi:MAG: hypothetical protein KDK61_08720 [Simkania sp.]|nr:hypothetical protein [Nanoarchaeota archaeon]MCB1084380.1 hypothetical protein [Simkania sp.]